MSLSFALKVARRYANGGAVDTNPSMAQRAAGNYKMRHITFQGIPISIENPKGTIRKGIDHTGKQWATRMTEDYGYIKRTEGHDGDQVDCFVGPNKKSDKVFVIDQIHNYAKDKFDEHKCMLGFNSEKQAFNAYKKSYGPSYGSRHEAAAVTEMNVVSFKEWLKGGGGKNPIAPGVPMQTGGAVTDESSIAFDPEFINKPKVKTPNIRVTEGHQEFEQGYAPSGRSPWNTDYPYRPILNTRGQELDALKIQTGGAVDEPAPEPPPEQPQMVSDEDLSRAQIAQQAAPREGGLMQTIPQFAQMVGTPEGRGKLWEAAKTEASQFIPGMVEQVKGPGEAMAGKMTPEQQADWAAGMGMGLIGTSLPFRFAEPSGGIGVFGGRGAVGHDAKALSQAEDMKAQGADKDAIYKQTGWFQDPHTDKWGFQIPMYTARLTRNVEPHPVFGNEGIVTIPHGMQGPLDEVLHMPRLFKMYPWLKDWKVRADHDNFMLDQVGQRGATLPDEKRIELSPAMPSEMLDTIVHEVNHIIQAHEGFSLGGNDAWFLPNDYPFSFGAALDKQKDIEAELKRSGFQDMPAIHKAIMDSFIEPRPDAVTAMDRAYIKGVERTGLLDDLKQSMGNVWKHQLMQNQAFDNYLTLHGEGMSRAAEYLRKIEPAKASKITPWQAMTQMRDPELWDQTIYSHHQAPVNWQSIAADTAPVDRFSNAVDRLQRTAGNMEADTNRRMLSSDRPTRNDLAARMANALLERYNRDPEQIRSYFQDARERGFDPQNIDLVKEYLPSNLFAQLPPSMSPTEAVGWLKENAPGVPHSLFRNQEDLTSYANTLRAIREGRQMPEARSPFLSEIEPSREAAFKETPPPEPGESMTDYPHDPGDFFYKPEELGSPPPDEYYSARTPEPPPPTRRYDSFNDKFREHIEPLYKDREPPPDPHSWVVTPVEHFLHDYFGGLYQPGEVIRDWGPHSGFTFEGNLVDPVRGTIGSISRAFNPETKSAYHGYLRVSPEVRRTGLVPTMLQNQISLYQKLGIEKVKLSANIDVGSYAWAKYGFKPTDMEWGMLRSRFQAQFDAGYIALDPRSNWGRHHFMDIMNNPDPKAIWDLADIDAVDTRSGEKVGKALLLNRSWGGTLDLTDAAAIKRFYDYVATKAKKKQP